MKGIKFPQANDTLGPPKGTTEEDVYTLHIHRTTQEIAGQQWPTVISCWEMDEAERAEFLRTGKLYMIVVGNTQPPMIVTPNSPFPEDKRRNTMQITLYIGDERLEVVAHWYYTDDEVRDGSFVRELNHSKKSGELILYMCDDGNFVNFDYVAHLIGATDLDATWNGGIFRNLTLYEDAGDWVKLLYTNFEPIEYFDPSKD